MTYAATLSSKGQMVIPAELRQKLGLKEGTKLSVGEEDGNIVIRVNRYNALLALRGTLAGYPLDQDLLDDPIRIRG